MQSWRHCEFAIAQCLGTTALHNSKLCILMSFSTNIFAIILYACLVDKHINVFQKIFINTIYYKKVNLIILPKSALKILQRNAIHVYSKVSSFVVNGAYS